MAKCFARFGPSPKKKAVTADTMESLLRKGEFVLNLTDVTKTGNGEWRMGNGEWGMGNGEWEIENGKWEMENGKWEIDFFFTLNF